jgi:vacuolar-type H+-ATPase subunit H
MTLPVRSETKGKHDLIDEARSSLGRAKEVLKKLKSSDPVTTDEHLRQAVKKSARQVKKAIAEADKLAKEWLDRIERVTDS